MFMNQLAIRNFFAWNSLILQFKSAQTNANVELKRAQINADLTYALPHTQKRPTSSVQSKQQLNRWK